MYCVIGDAESAEGSVWEAMNFASHYNLDNLCAIFDINRLGQSDPTMLQHDFATYKKRTEAFGSVDLFLALAALFLLNFLRIFYFYVLCRDLT